MFSELVGRVRARRCGGAMLGLFLVVSISACAGTGDDERTDASDEGAAPEAAAPAAAPRVFFVEPADGATVTPPVHLVFGAEGFVIEEVGDGAIHPGAGHMHVGLDTDCLPPGEIIPTANPWVHFGLAQMEFDLDLPPGEHRIVLQIGDGEHRTLDEPGLCATLTVTAE